MYYSNSPSKNLARWLELFPYPIEIRTFAGGKTVSGYFEDKALLVQAIEFLQSPEGEEKYGKIQAIYTTINEFDPELLARKNRNCLAYVGGGETTADKDIIRRRWLVVDCDRSEGR